MEVTYDLENKALKDQVTKLNASNKQLTDLVKSLMQKMTDLQSKLSVEE
jgi:hypothetical protein